MNVFIMKVYGKANKYGVGSYTAMLKWVLLQQPDINVYVVHINASHQQDGSHVKNGSLNDIYISFESPHETAVDEYYISLSQAHAIYCILMSHVKEGDRNVLHLNTPMEMYLAEVAKEYDHFHVFYTMHVLLWQVFYNNDFRKFNTDWENREENEYIPSMQAEMKLCHLADKIICLTNEAINFTQTVYDTPSSKLKIVHNAINTENTEILSAARKRALREEFGFNTDYPIILFSGRLIYQKGFGYAIEALRQLAGRNMNFHFVICGEGNLSHFEDRCKDIHDKIVFAGFVDKTTLYKYYQLADIGLLPSFIEQNSFSALEMMAHGLPIIVSDTDAFAHFKSDRQNVIYINANNRTEAEFITLLEDALIKAITDTSYRQQVGVNAHALINNRFSTKKMTSTDIYGKII